LFENPPVLPIDIAYYGYYSYLRLEEEETLNGLELYSSLLAILGTKPAFVSLCLDVTGNHSSLALESIFEVCETVRVAIYGISLS